MLSPKSKGLTTPHSPSRADSQIGDTNFITGAKTNLGIKLDPLPPRKPIDFTVPSKMNDYIDMSTVNILATLHPSRDSNQDLLNRLSPRISIETKDKVTFMNRGSSVQ